MLAWTPAGAVARPRTLQVRVHRAYPERVPAGAPAPTRSMSTDEVIANLRWFTAAGPRGLPVDSLVLSGQGVASRPDLADIVAVARSSGVERVVVHAGAEDLAAVPRIPGVDRYVLPVRLGPGGAAEAAVAAAFGGARAAGVAVDANAPLAADTLAEVPRAAALAVAGGAVSLTFTYPYPSAGAPPPPPVPAAVEAARAGVERVAGTGVALGVKGLPACWLGALAGLARKTANRWYVDADHQREGAMLFFPGVIAFAKEDACRFCAADPRCDGPVAAWSGRPENPPLRAFDAG